MYSTLPELQNYNARLYFKKVKNFLNTCRLIFCNYFVSVPINCENKFYCRRGFEDEYTAVQGALADMAHLPISTVTVVSHRCLLRVKYIRNLITRIKSAASTFG